MTHADNLARVKALRDAFDGRSVASLPSGDVISCRLLFRLLDEIEGTLTRHAPLALGDNTEVCTTCRTAYFLEAADFPCDDYASALRLLDKLDPRVIVDVTHDMQIDEPRRIKTKKTKRNMI